MTQTRADLWTMAQLVDLLADLARNGWGVRTSSYGTHSGDSSENPWRGPLACEVTVSEWRRPGPVSLADVNTLDSIVQRHGAQMNLNLSYGEDSVGIARVGHGPYGERFLIDA